MRTIYHLCIVTYSLFIHGGSTVASSQPCLSLCTSGTPINKRPVLGYRNLNLFKLYRLVHKLGGFDSVSPSPAHLFSVSHFPPFQPYFYF